MLLLLGPFGGLVLLAIVLRRRREVLTLELPYGEAAYERHVAARPARRATALLVAATVIAVALLAARCGPLGPLAVLAAGSLVAAALPAAALTDAYPRRRC